MPAPQADRQLGPAWKLMKADAPGVPELSEWLAKLPAGVRVGIDPFVHTNEVRARFRQNRRGRGLLRLAAGCS